MFNWFAELTSTPDTLNTLDAFFIGIKHFMALMGSLVIFFGALFVIFQFIVSLLRSNHRQLLNFDTARLGLTRSIALGLEFIIAADVIQTTATPDYYAVGILAALAAIRAFLNYFLNKDLESLSKKENRDRFQPEERTRDSTIS